MYKAKGGMGMRLGERGSVSWTTPHTPRLAQVGPSWPKFAQVKNLRRGWRYSALCQGIAAERQVVAVLANAHA